MPERSHPLTIGGRVNDRQMARVDAASRLARLPRAHFVVEAALEKAERILCVAVSEFGDDAADRLIAREVVARPGMSSP